MVSEAKDKLLYTNKTTKRFSEHLRTGPLPPVTTVITEISDVFTSSQSHFPRSYSSQYSYTRFDLCDVWVVVHEVGLGFAAAAELLVYIIIWSPKWKAMKGPIVAIECVCNNVQHKYCTAICSGQFSQF